jgi:hypothetical protein
VNPLYTVLASAVEYKDDLASACAYADFVKEQGMDPLLCKFADAVVKARRWGKHHVWMWKFWDGKDLHEVVAMPYVARFDVVKLRKVSYGGYEAYSRYVLAQLAPKDGKTILAEQTLPQEVFDKEQFGIIWQFNTTPVLNVAPWMVTEFNLFLDDYLRSKATKIKPSLNRHHMSYRLAKDHEEKTRRKNRSVAKQVLAAIRA